MPQPRVREQPAPVLLTETLRLNDRCAHDKDLERPGPIVIFDAMAFASFAEQQNGEPLLRAVMPELDTVRGLAILMVVVYHGFYWQVDVSAFATPVKLALTAAWAGRFGVNLFFVLSGFLITGILLDATARPDYYRHFYLRRALRILPAYYGILLVLFLTRYCSNAFLALSAVYLSNLTRLAGVHEGYPVLWSLAVEEQYYLVWPTIVRKLRPAYLLWSSLAIVALTPLSRVASLYISVARHGYVSYWFNNYTWNSLDGLACGAVLALALRMFPWSRGRWLRVACWTLGVSVAAWCIALPFGILSRKGTYVGAALQVTPLNIGFTATLALFLLAGTSRWKVLVLLRPLRYLGYISYGLYLMHLLVFNAYDWASAKYWPNSHATAGALPALFVRFVAVFAAAVALAHCSRKYFEEFFLRFKKRV